MGEEWSGFPDLWSCQKLIFNPRGEFRRSPEGPVSQIHSHHLHVCAPAIISDLLRSVQVLKRELGTESNGSYRTYSILGKTAALVPEFALEDLLSAELQPRFLRLQWRTCPSEEHIYIALLSEFAYFKWFAYELFIIFAVYNWDVQS